MTGDGLLRIESWARDGLTDEQIAQNIGISRGTLYEWINKYPNIGDALKKGKAPVDFQVENALLKRALGYDYEEVVTEVEDVPTGKTDPNGQPVMKQRKHVRKTKKHVPGDTLAMMYWLKNRRPDKWRDKPVEQGDTATMEKLDKMLQEVRNHASNA